MNTMMKCRRANRWIAAVALLGISGFSQKDNFTSYLGAAWGLDGDTIYCIKQVDSPQRHFWLCKMNWDGSDKKDISELWPNRDVSVNTQDGALWLEVNTATSNIAFSVVYGTEVGMWIMGLEGKNLHRPFPLIWNAKERWAPLHPSWSPDGTKIVYEEDDCTSPTSSVTRLVMYDLQKKERRQLTDGPRDQHPVWSPKGDWIAFTHYLQFNDSSADRRIWLIRPDGSEQRPVVDAKGKPIFGWWPSWNPEGTKVSINTGLLVMADITTNKTERLDPLSIMGVRSPWLLIGHHWGRRGWLWIGRNLIFVDATTHRAWMIEGDAPVALRGKE